MFRSEDMGLLVTIVINYWPNKLQCSIKIHKKSDYVEKYLVNLLALHYWEKSLVSRLLVQWYDLYCIWYGMDTCINSWHRSTLNISYGDLSFWGLWVTFTFSFSKLLFKVLFKMV